MMNLKNYDVIVVGAGHAGCEAALASARLGQNTLLLTGNIDMIGAMSCNPAIGGLGKGHLVREIDALGGEMGKNIDETGIQFRRLNTRKGPAVQGTRAQADKYLYKERMRFVIENTPLLDIKQGLVSRLLIDAKKISGVEMTLGYRYFARSVILTTGTFLQGLCHVGLKNFQAGRAGDVVSVGLSRSLVDDCGLELMRLKTGTVPRLDRRTIDISKLEVQNSDDPLPLFSFLPTRIRQKQVPCYITYTNSQTHDLIRRDFDKSPIFQGVISGRGPRYCPSIEDKVARFADRDRHQIFLEPEGLSTNEVYPNGVSTSLPFETQIAFMRTIPGCENVEITRPGYAVEYDAVPPTQLKRSLETKTIEGLFLAGQINGTTGYEEAAAQGLVAGINAVHYNKNLPPFQLSREQAYIGVLIDDLITKGVGGEPYRMFTSRAEYRLHLREDNADVRLTEIGFQLGLADASRYELLQTKRQNIDKIQSYLERTHLAAKDTDLLEKLTDILQRPVPSEANLFQICKWPEFTNLEFAQIWSDLNLEIAYSDDLASSLLSQIKYAGYIERHQREIRKMADFEKIKIPPHFDFFGLPSLSSEVKEKLSKHQPETLAQALRIPGITPAAVSHLEICIAASRHKL